MRWSLASVALLTITVGLSAQPPGGAPSPPGLPSGPGGFYPGPGGYNSLSNQYKDLIPGLIEALKDLDQEVRQHSAMALASIGREAVQPLLKVLEDKESIKEKRAAAAYALGQMGYNAHEGLPTLLKALKDEDALVRRSASQAISRIVSADTFAGGGMMPGFRGFGPAGGGFGGGVGSAPAPFPGATAPTAPSLPPVPTRPGAAEPPKPDKPEKTEPKPDKPNR